MIVYTKAPGGSGISQMLRASKSQPPARPGLGHAPGLRRGWNWSKGRSEARAGLGHGANLDVGTMGAWSGKRGWGGHVPLILKFSNH